MSLCAHLLASVFVLHDDIFLLASTMKCQEPNRRKCCPYPPWALHKGACALVIPNRGAFPLLDCALANPDALAISTIPKRLVLTLLKTPLRHPLCHLSRYLQFLEFQQLVAFLWLEFALVCAQSKQGVPRTYSPAARPPRNPTEPRCWRFTLCASIFGCDCRGRRSKLRRRY